MSADPKRSDPYFKTVNTPKIVDQLQEWQRWGKCQFEYFGKEIKVYLSDGKNVNDFKKTLK